jgi:hypothetical protein
MLDYQGLAGNQTNYQRVRKYPLFGLGIRCSIHLSYRGNVAHYTISLVFGQYQK